MNLCIVHVYAYLYVFLYDSGVDSSYKGPRLEGDITSQFMTDLTEWFKEQKSLHKKYALKIILEAKKIFQSLPSLVSVSIPEVQCMLYTICIMNVILYYLYFYVV